MSVLRSLFGRLLFGGTRELRPYETACLQAWKEKLSSEGAAVLSRQLSRFNLFQRSPDGRLVTFFDTKDKSCATWGSKDCFPLRAEEISVARVWLRAPESPQQLEIKADVVLHRGRLSSIEFNKQPESLRTGAQVTKVKTLLDPMRQWEAGAPISLSEIPDGFQEQLRRLRATDLRKPLSPAQREEIIQTIDSNLPGDYMELVVFTNGVSIKGWRIYGLAEIRRIVQPEGNFYLIAEATDGRALGVRQGASDAQLYIVSHEGEKPNATGQSLLANIERNLVENPDNAAS
jgi:hypothetical protein